MSNSFSIALQMKSVSTTSNSNYMKKVILFSLLFLAGIAMGAQGKSNVSVPKKSNPQDSLGIVVVTEQPQGTLKLYVRKGNVLDSDLSGVAESDATGSVLKVVYGDDGESVWFCNLTFPTEDYSESWVRGEIVDENTIEIREGQYTEYDYDDEEDYYTAFKLTRITTNPDGEAGTRSGWMYLPGEITFTFDSDSTLTLQPGSDGSLAIGQIRETTDTFMVNRGYNGKFLGYGETNCVFVPLSQVAGAPVSPDASLHVDTVSMSNYYNTQGLVTGRKSLLAIDGDDVYLGNFTDSYFTDGWIRGKKNGNKVVFPSKQYMGVASHFAIYFMGATIETDEDGESYYALSDDITFTFDDQQKTLSSDGTMVLNAWTESVRVGESFMQPKFQYLNDEAAKPATPNLGRSYVAYNENLGYGQIAVAVPCVDTEGNNLNVDKITFKFFIDGNEYTFTPEKDYTSEVITDIPYTYSCYAVKAYIPGYYRIYTTAPFENYYAVQSYYHNGNTVTASDMAYYPSAPTKISSAAQTGQPSRVNVYDLQGRQVATNVDANTLTLHHGAYILKDVTTGQSHKVMIK